MCRVPVSSRHAVVVLFTDRSLSVQSHLFYFSKFRITRKNFNVFHQWKLSVQELHMYVWHCQFSWDLTTKFDRTLYNMTIIFMKKWRLLSAIVASSPLLLRFVATVDQIQNPFNENMHKGITIDVIYKQNKYKWCLLCIKDH